MTLLCVQVLHDGANYREGVLVVLGEVVGYARAAGVDVGAAELLGGDFFARRGLNQGGPPRKIVPVPFTITTSSLIAGT